MSQFEKLNIMSPEWIDYSNYIVGCGVIACQLARVEHNDFCGVVAAISAESVHVLLDQNGYPTDLDDYFDLHRSLVIDELRTIFELTASADGES